MSLRPSALPGWIQRYLFQDLVSFAGALLAWNLAYSCWGRLGPANLAAVTAETICFYATAFACEWWRQRGSASPAPVRELCRRLAGEYGPAEAADLLVIRPIFFWAAIDVCASPLLGVLVGGFLADLVFYANAHAAHVRLKHLQAKSASREELDLAALHARVEIDL